MSNSQSSDSKIFSILTTPPSGQETSTQTLVYNSGACALWLDASDATCTTTISGAHPQLTTIIEKSISAIFSYGWAEDPSQNTNGAGQSTYLTAVMKNPAAGIKDGYYYTQGDPILDTPAPITLADAQGQFTFFYAGEYDTSAVASKTWLFINDNDRSGSHYSPNDTNLGGLLLTQTGATTFTLALSGPNGHTLTSSTLTIPNPSFLLTVQVVRNAYGYPNVTVRVSGQVAYTYDAGTTNPLGLVFNNLAFTGTGAPSGTPGGVLAFGEIIAYKDVIDPGNVLAIETYLQTKWVTVAFPVTMGDLSTTVGIAGSGFSAVLPIVNGATVTVTPNTPAAGSNWQATAPADGSNNWLISGVLPPSVSAVTLTIHATDISGTQSATKNFLVIGTATGTVSGAQHLVYDNAAQVWIDPSDPTTLDVDLATGRLRGIVDKVATAKFVLSSSQTPNSDTSSFAQSGIALALPNESDSGTNYAIALDPASRPDLFVVDPNTFALPAGSAPINTPMGNGFTVSDASGFYTIFQVLRYNGKPGGNGFAEMVLSNDFPSPAINGWAVAAWGLKTPTLGSTEGTFYQKDALLDTSLTVGTRDIENSQFNLDPGATAVVVWRNYPGLGQPGNLVVGNGDTASGDQLWGYDLFMLPFDATIGTPGAKALIFQDYSPNAWDLSGSKTKLNIDASDTPFPGVPTTSWTPATNLASLPLPASKTAYNWLKLDGTNADFTIEGWVKSPTAAGQTFPTTALYNSFPTAGTPKGTDGFAINLGDAAVSNFPAVWVYNYSTTTPLITGGTLIQDNHWHHVALTRQGTTWTLWLDGVSIGTATYAGKMHTGTGSVAGYVGGDPISGNNYPKMHLSHFRITVGWPRYTATFTPDVLPPPRGPVPNAISGPGGPDIRVNGISTAVTFGSGDAAHWTTPLQKFTKIAGVHAIGALGETLIFPYALGDATMASIEAYLTAKWFLQTGSPPSIGLPSPNHQFASYPYDGTITITNGSSDPIEASVVANAGTNWALHQDQVVPGLFHLTGVMPPQVQAVILTITAKQSGATNVAPVSLHSDAPPLTPEIGTLSPIAATAGSAYVGKLVITNVHGHDGTLGVTVSASMGSNWSVQVDPLGAQDTYEITGTMPVAITDFNLLVTAEDASSDDLIAVNAQRSFVMSTTGDESILPTRYPLDLTGLLQSNLIRFESQTLTPANGPGSQFLVPKLGPFFAEGLVVQYHDMTSQSLVTAKKGFDYDVFFEFTTLSRATMTPIYGAISFLNLKIQGEVILTYQTIGGNFVIDRQALLEGLTELVVNQKQIRWTNVVQVPPYFPVAPHEHDAETQLIGASGLVAGMTAIQTAYTNSGGSSDLAAMMTHIGRQDNPHKVGPDQINLGNVPNFPIATPAQANDHTNQTVILTPKTAAAAGAADVVAATGGVYGIAPLNLGNTPGDDSNATDALTAGGLLALMKAATPNQIQQNFTSGDTAVKFSPWPISFPVWWRGIQYANVADLVSAVRTLVDVSNLPFNGLTGTLYFPRGIIPPSLVVTTSNTYPNWVNGTTNDPMNMPMMVPTP